MWIVSGSAAILFALINVVLTFQEKDGGLAGDIHIAYGVDYLCILEYGRKTGPSRRLKCFDGCRTYDDEGLPGFDGCVHCYKGSIFSEDKSKVKKLNTNIAKKDEKLL